MRQIIEGLSNTLEPINYRKGADKALSGIILLGNGETISTIVGNTITLELYPESNKGGDVVSLPVTITTAANGTVGILIPDTNNLVVGTTYNGYLVATNGAVVESAQNPIALKVS